MGDFPSISSWADSTDCEVCDGRVRFGGIFPQSLHSSFPWVSGSVTPRTHQDTGLSSSWYALIACYGSILRNAVPVFTWVHSVCQVRISHRAKPYFARNGVKRNYLWLWNFGKVSSEYSLKYTLFFREERHFWENSVVTTKKKKKKKKKKKVSEWDNIANKCQQRLRTQFSVIYRLTCLRGFRNCLTPQKRDNVSSCRWLVCFRMQFRDFSMFFGNL